MQAISVKQPWCWAIARGHRKISNQSLPTAYRGPLLIHAAMRVDLDASSSPLIRAAGWDPHDPLATMGAAIAVAELDDVCAAATESRPCACGPWSEPGFYHWRLTSIRPLPRPIVALGRPTLWEPPATLTTEVHAMLATAAAADR